MIPILFNHDATSFTTHGIGDLRETISCESVVNSDGEYELELQYPVGGEYINGLVYNNIIVAKVNDHGNYQAFRIYGVSKAINSIVTVRAQHLSYDLSCVVVKDYTSTTCSNAMYWLKANAIGGGAMPFTFYTNIPDSQQAQNQDRQFKMEEPQTLRSALLDGDDSIKGCWGGDLVFDNYSVQLLSVAGADRGVLIEYGIDLIDMEQEENISEMITGVYPYWKGREEGSESDEDKTVYGDTQYASGTFTRHRIVPLNVTEYYPNNTMAPSVSEINQTARDWIVANEIGQPVINLTLSYAELGKDVRLYDAVTVRFVKIGIDVKAKVISYRYDVLKERCIEVEVGSAKPSILFSLEDASRLKRGLIPPKRIANNSITSDMIQNYGVDSSNLGTGAVTEKKIADEAVTENKISDLAVTEYKLGPLSVTEGKLAEGSVTNGKIGPVAVTGDKIRNLAVTTEKLGDYAVTSAKIGEAAVTNYAVYKGNNQLLRLDGKNLKDASVNTLQIGESAITSTQIAEGAVINEKVYKGTNQLYKIDGQKLKNYSVDTLQIGDSAIISDKIEDGAVIHDKVYHGNNQDLRLDGYNIKNYSMNTLQIGSSAITSVKIADGAVIDGKIGGKAVKYKNVDDLQIDQLKLGSMSVTVEKVGRGGYVQIPGSVTPQNPQGQWEWRDELIDSDYTTYYDEEGNPYQVATDSSPAIAPGGVAYVHMGDYQIAEVKMSLSAQKTLVAAWRVQEIVSEIALIDDLGTRYLACDHLSVGNAYGSNYFEANNTTTELGNNVYIWGQPISYVTVEETGGLEVTVLAIPNQNY